MQKSNETYSQEQIDKLVKAGTPLTGDQSRWRLHYWWEEDQTYASDDKAPVTAAMLYGGQMALIYTAAVPALLALGYLFLILYFRARGGYVAEVLTGHAAEDEEFTGGVEGPAELYASTPSGASTRPSSRYRSRAARRGRPSPPPWLAVWSSVPG